LRFLNSFSRRIAARPLLGISAVVAITLLASLSVVVNGVEQSFEVTQFEPDSDAVAADALVRESFTYQYNVAVLTEFHWRPYDPPESPVEGNLLKSQFLQVLEFEKGVSTDPRISPAVDTPGEIGRSIVSPVSLVSLIMFQKYMEENQQAWEEMGLELRTLKDPETGDPVLDGDGEEVLYAPGTYGNVIKYMSSSKVLTATIHRAINLLMTNETVPLELRENLSRLFSSDLSYESIPVNASACVVLIRLDRDKVLEQGSRYDAESIIAEAAKEGSSRWLTLTAYGESLIYNEIEEAGMHDLQSLFPLAVLAVVMVLMVFLRDPLEVAVTVSCLLAAIIWVYGLGAAAGIVFSPLSLAVPFLVLGVGMDFSIHLFLRYRQESLLRGDALLRLTGTMRKVGEAIVLATVTTCIAYMMNVVSGMEGVIQFGVLNALGVLSAFVIIMLVVPGVLVLRERRRPRRVLRPAVGSLDLLLHGALRLVRRRGTAVMAAMLVLTAALGAAAANVQMDFEIAEFLPEGSDSEKAGPYLEENFMASGRSKAYVLVHGGFADPSLLEALQECIDRLDDNEHVISVGGRADLESVFTTMRDWGTLSGPGDERYDPAFAALYGLHFDKDSGSYLGGADAGQLTELLQTMQENPRLAKELERHLNVEAGMMRLSIGLPEDMSESSLLAMRAAIESDLDPLRQEGYVATLTGPKITGLDIIEGMREAQTLSVFLTLGMALVIICGLSLLRGRGLAMGVLAVAPATMAIIWMWGALYLLGISLNPLTITVAALTVGLGVDYGIHMTNRFSQELASSGVEEALRSTVVETGKGVLGAAATTGLGFAMLGFFSIPPIAQFGLITMASVLFSMLISILLLPVAMAHLARRGGFSG